MKSASGPNFYGYVRDHLASKGFAAAWSRKTKIYIIYKVLFLINKIKIDFFTFFRYNDQIIFLQFRFAEVSQHHRILQPQLP
ncbi:MAG: hypothetical protein WCL48_12015, partial [Betaproteobacteria bacterium]